MAVRRLFVVPGVLAYPRSAQARGMPLSIDMDIDADCKEYG